MTDSPFRGVIPPVVIPLTEKRQLDLEALERSINRMIDAGVDGLFFLGSSGEVAFLTDAQRYHVLQEAVAMVNGRVPVLAGIIDMETMRVIDQAKRATGYGVDAVVATAPFYALGGPREVERHFRAIREHTDLPLFAYDLPACVHTKLDPTMLVRLGEDGVLQGVKDSSGDDVSFRWLCLQNEDAGHPLQVLTGHEVGGVCPFANPEHVTTYLDVSMQRFPSVFPAAGSASSAIELTCEELFKYSQAREWIDVCKAKDVQAI